MGKLLVFVGRVIALIVLALAMLWSSLALWFHLPLEAGGRYAVILAVCIIGAGSMLSIAGQTKFRFHYVFAAGFAILLIWWATIEPPRDLEWAPDVARQTTGTIEGDRLVLQNVRAFDWQTDQVAEEHWVEREYDLSTVETLDLFLSYWAGPEMAHFILSFGFEDGRHLAWSVEVRRAKDGLYSPIADAFKANPLVILAAEETDVVGLRTNKRGEDVYLYRLNTKPDTIRRLLEQYVKDANALAMEPKWYNSITTNCTTDVFRMFEAMGLSITFDWRILVNGYLPEFAYEQGTLNTAYTLEELRAAGRIGERARAAGLEPGFSAAIRDGVPEASDS